MAEQAHAALSKLVPGFDFLQGLVKNAGAALPGVGQWIAPTLDPQELDKRIEELRTVQFWLEQNARMLGATIQALEVQRMTLATLKSMNVSVGQLRDSLSVKPAAKKTRAQARPAGGDTSPISAVPGVVDPAQWWGALTKQFTSLATQALKDGAKNSAGDAARNLGAAMVRQGLDAANQSLKKAAEIPGRVARKTGKTQAPPRKPAPNRRRTPRG